MLPRANAYLRSLRKIERSALADRCGIKLTSLNNVIYGKRLSVALACRIERETGGAVTRRELLPEVDWDLLSGTSLDRALAESR
jgi:DNA-binding transcriptional regulator YdaS (Cro superfamily)|nr:MAG TPA: Putative antitoxin of bacterial toxin-antitoxin system, YdaS/YdaT [Caudoviricetes sp.]DAR32918.1 MAG TPA: Putative antitoxin of bacterial toxin-antitoxin system, YdaS/YdaT [Caudoviricetes sp.]